MYSFSAELVLMESSLLTLTAFPQGHSSCFLPTKAANLKMCIKQRKNLKIDKKPIFSVFLFQHDTHWQPFNWAFQNDRDGELLDLPHPCCYLMSQRTKNSYCPIHMDLRLLDSNTISYILFKDVSCGWSQSVSKEVLKGVKVVTRSEP